jgi:TonB-linked SusC/RagA family outer membrane protein
MKNTKLIFLVSLLLWATTAHSQNATVTIQADKIKLDALFTEIEAQTDVKFIYRHDNIDGKTAKVNVSKTSVFDVLDNVLPPNGLKYSVMAYNLVVITSVEEAKEMTVAGIITDDTGETLPGVNITIKGSSKGVVSDMDGKYVISVPEDATLLFAFIGMKTQEAPVNGRTHIDIRMDIEDRLIDEVIVMGYSSKTKTELSSSLVTLSSNKLLDVTASNVASMMQGKAAGVMVSTATGAPGATPEILIRGAGSITAQATPLYVVDGIIGGNYNPNDVETLTILKDAAATSLYGSAAAGGVIIITTKHGKYGQKTTVDFRTTFGRKTIDNGNFQLMDAVALFDFQKSVMSPDQFEVSRPVKLKKQDFNWVDAAFHPGYIQNYYLAVSGGTQNMNYRLSADYYNEDGTLIGSSYERLNIRSNMNAKLYENLTLKANISFMHSKNNNNLWYVLEDAYKNMPWDNPYDKEGNLVFINSAKRPDDGATWYGNRRMNFLQNAQYNYDQFTGNGITGDVVLSWNITDWLSFESRNRASTDNGFQKTFVDSRTFDITWNNRGANTESNTINYSLGTTNLILAKKNFGKHALDGFIGMESGVWNNRYTTASAVDLPLVGLPSLSTGATPQPPLGSLVEGAGISYLGQAQYMYNNKYIALASVRTDGSSTFGPNNRWGVFPAGSLAWLISNEAFLKDNKLITFLKLRGSFGITGNSNIGQYRYLSNYSFTSNYNGVTGALPQNLPNPDLGWESAWMSNVGIDVNLAKRVDLSVELYNTDNKDLLLNVPVSPSEGYEYKLQNTGSVRNQGIEVQISSLNMKGDFTWTTDFNIAFNRNRALNTPYGAFTRSAGGTTMLNQIIEEGEDIFTWYMPKWLGVDEATGKPMWERTKDDNGNPIAPEVTNEYAKATPQKVGKATPLFIGGLTNTFAYKGFALSANCNFVYKNLIYNQGREYFDSDGAILDMNQMVLADGWSRWEKPGDVATHPKPMVNGNNGAQKTSSRYLEDGSYFRLRNVTLSYTVPEKWINSLKISNLRVYVSADNLFTYTKYSGMDPEVSYQMAEWSLPGMQMFKYPLSKQFLGGLELKF